MEQVTPLQVLSPKQRKLLETTVLEIKEHGGEYLRAAYPGAWRVRLLTAAVLLIMEAVFLWFLWAVVSGVIRTKGATLTEPLGTVALVLGVIGALVGAAFMTWALAGIARRLWVRIEVLVDPERVQVTLVDWGKCGRWVLPRSVLTRAEAPVEHGARDVMRSACLVLHTGTEEVRVPVYQGIDEPRWRGVVQALQMVTTVEHVARRYRKGA